MFLLDSHVELPYNPKSILVAITIAFVKFRIVKAMDLVHAGANVVRSSGLVATVLKMVESFLDAGDAVRRRKKRTE